MANLLQNDDDSSGTDPDMPALTDSPPNPAPNPVPNPDDQSSTSAFANAIHERIPKIKKKCIKKTKDKKK